ncbi:MAG: TonB-dependent receptor [bacterium]|nr:TonB-dependent receptor [bacterium]
MDGHHKIPFGTRIISQVLCTFLGFGLLPVDATDLTHLSLEDLANFEITTLARKEQNLFDTSAPVYVITDEELERSGMRTLPDALRLVPGLFVAHVDANKWVVTSRGFPGLFANKLLVLIDGRSVYTPLFSGVFWETQDILIEDIARIEIIRGPGGALWGANAVNGIINVITKTAYNTTGVFLQGGTGTERQRHFVAQYGGAWRSKGAYRVFGKHFKEDNSYALTPFGSQDNWHFERVGIRVDLSSTHHLEAEVYSGSVGQSFRLIKELIPPFETRLHSRASVSGGHLLGHFDYQTENWGMASIQAYYDRARRQEEILQGVIQTADMDFHHQFEMGSGLETVWGLGYRRIWDQFEGSLTARLDPEKRTTHLLTGFYQQDLWIFQERLRLTGGTKLEHNSFTGFEWQPNARLWFSLTNRQALWSSISRSTRTPSRSDHDFRGTFLLFPEDSLFQNAPAVLGSLSENQSFQSEILAALDIGYRARLGQSFVLDIAAFRNSYDQLRSTEILIDSLRFMQNPLYIRVPARSGNLADGISKGVEVTADWQASPKWRLRMAYSYFDMSLTVDPTSTDLVTPTYAHETPAHQANIRSYFKLRPNLSLDVTGRFADGLPTQHVEQYVTADVRVDWHSNDLVHFTFTGRNLANRKHQEFILL